MLSRNVHKRLVLAGRGTTHTATLWSGGYLALAHIGDSREYRLRHGHSGS
jgi:PPM family protein phosphatase